MSSAEAPLCRLRRRPGRRRNGCRKREAQSTSCAACLTVKKLRGSGGLDADWSRVPSASNSMRSATMGRQASASFGFSTTLPEGRKTTTCAVKGAGLSLSGVAKLFRAAVVTGGASAGVLCQEKETRPWLQPRHDI